MGTRTISIRQTDNKTVLMGQDNNRNKLLKSNKWDAIFWMDADSWFLNCEISLDKWLQEPEEIQFTGDINVCLTEGTSCWKILINLLSG